MGSLAELLEAPSMDMFEDLDRNVRDGTNRNAVVN